MSTAARAFITALCGLSPVTFTTVATAAPGYTTVKQAAGHAVEVGDRQRGVHSERSQWFDARDAVPSESIPLVMHGRVHDVDQDRALHLRVHDGAVERCDLVFSTLDKPGPTEGTKRVYVAALDALRPEAPFTFRTLRRAGSTYKAITFHCEGNAECFEGHEHTCPVESEWVESGAYSVPRDVPQSLQSMHCATDPEFKALPRLLPLRRQRVTVLVAPSDLPAALTSASLAMQCQEGRRVASGRTRVGWTGDASDTPVLRGRVTAGESPQELCRVNVWGRDRLGYVTSYRDDSVDGGAAIRSCRLRDSLGHVYRRTVPGWSAFTMAWRGAQRDVFAGIERLAMNNAKGAALSGALRWAPPAADGSPPARPVRLAQTRRPASGAFGSDANTYICRHGASGRVGETVDGSNRCELLDGSLVTSDFDILTTKRHD